MGDDELLSSGPDEPSRVPRPVIVLAALLALLAGYQGVRQLTAAGTEDRAEDSPRPLPTAAEVPAPEPLRTTTGVRVLAVSGPDLAWVQVDTGQVTRLDDASWRHGGEVRALVSRPAGQVVLARTDTDRAWLVSPSGTAESLGPASAIAPVGTDAVAVSTETPAGVTVQAYRLSPIRAVGRPVRLPAGSTVVAGSAIGAGPGGPAVFLVELRARGAPALELRDGGSGRLVRTLSRPGHALTSDGQRVAWLRPGCGSQCLVRYTDLTAGGDEVVAVLDGERISAAAFAPDGRLAIAGSFRLAQLSQRQPAAVISGRFPFAIRTTALMAVPTALAWSPNGRWAFLGDPGGGLLAWNRRDGTLYRVPVPPGTLRSTAFLAAVPG